VAGSRHQARELALQVLFQIDGDAAADADEQLSYLAQEAGVSERAREFASGLIRGVVAHREELDQVILEASQNWRLEQMGRVDRAVLRLATFEIRHGQGVPVKAAINESIELAKTFSGHESGRFVNGVLGRIAALTTP